MKVVLFYFNIHISNEIITFRQYKTKTKITKNGKTRLNGVTYKKGIREQDHDDK